MDKTHAKIVAQETCLFSFKLGPPSRGLFKVLVGFSTRSRFTLLTIQRTSTTAHHGGISWKEATESNSRPLVWQCYVFHTCPQYYDLCQNNDGKKDPKNFFDLF